MQWFCRKSAGLHFILLSTISFLLTNLEASFLNFQNAGGACNCARPCPPATICPISYAPCPASCSNSYRPSYSTSYAMPIAYPSSSSYYASSYPGYVATSYPGYVASNYPGYSASSYPGYVASASNYAQPTLLGNSYAVSQSTSGGGSYSSLPLASSSYGRGSSYVLPPSSSPSGGSSYGAPQMTESNGYIYPPPNQTPYSSSYVSAYTYTPTSSANSFYNSGTATVNPSVGTDFKALAESDIEMSTDFKTMPFVDVSYKSKELTPVDIFERRNMVLTSLRERQMRQFSAPAHESIAYEAPNVCNNHKLGKIMVKAMVADISISKRLVRSATELAFTGKKFDVFCATGDFSYSIYAEQYCEATRGNVTCFAFY